MKTGFRVGNRSMGGMLLALAIVAALTAGPVQPAAAATQTDIAGPAGSGAFGTTVTVLPNGNIVVTDPYYDAGTTEDVGAVYLYDGATGTLISTLTGSTAGDQVGSGMYGSGAVTVLISGNYVVCSPNWDDGAVLNVGAVTWGDGTTGVSGVVSAANSLVGSTAGDFVGSAVTALTNGNYVVASWYWHNGGVADAGAVTWGDGTTGIAGAVTEANSLVGSSAQDYVGFVTALSNGNYVVRSTDWDNGAVVDVGAATWGDGTSGIAGPVSAANSLVGSTAGDHVGSLATALTNGNYVVASFDWHNGAVEYAGAVTWGDGTTGIAGPVTEDNSLVGSAYWDLVGGVTALSNGHYVVSSSHWDNGAVVDVGAVTWGDGTIGIAGPVSASNSLVGSTAGDRVGSVTALTNGNYVVRSTLWDNGAVVDAGAVTWRNGTTGTSGVVSASNSLVGSTAGDRIGSCFVTPLNNGHYVVNSCEWDNGAVVDAGAVTWGDGTTGSTGPVSASNSLVGATAGDRVGFGGVIPLRNGNYVVGSPNWDNGAVSDAGAVTWGAGTACVSGAVSAANSLVGSTADDKVGSVRLTALTNGNYVVASPYWDNGAVVDAGAATWGAGTTGIVGEVSATNSLVGSTEGDSVGSDWPGMRAVSNGHYVLPSPYWDNGATVDAGAVTWGDGSGGTTGPITAENSVLGTAEDGGESMCWAYDDVNHQLVVGRPADNIVTLFRLLPVYTVFLPVILRNAP
jgi:hypothetical protein